MHYSVLSLRQVRVAAVLVHIGQLHDEKLINELQARLTLPVMLVAQDDRDWRGVKAWAQFDTRPYLTVLLSLENVEWSELPEPAEPELPF